MLLRQIFSFEVAGRTIIKIWTFMHPTPAESSATKQFPILSGCETQLGGLTMRKKVTFEFEDELLAQVSKTARGRQNSVRSVIRRFLRDMAEAERRCEVSMQPDASLLGNSS